MSTLSPSAHNGPTSISTKNREEWSRCEFWTELIDLSFLTISQKTLTSSTMKDCDPVAGRRRRESLQQRGFVLVDDSICQREDVVASLCKGIQHIQKLGLPASFILLFDQTWQLAYESWKILQTSTLETNKFQFDILAWCITSDGFSPHRDRQPDIDARQTFDNETMDPKFVTHWIALTEATPENSCLYMIPKDQDPGYFKGDSDEADPLSLALPNKQAYQQIRAIPRQTGQSVLFTHRIIHWGSARDPHTELPFRTAISFVCSDPTFEKPYVDPKHFDVEQDTTRCPPFQIRLVLVCAQMLIYYQRFDLSRDFIKACYEYCKDHEDLLEVTYRQKVFVEFVKATNEHENATASPQNGEADEDDNEEDAMAEMLEAAKKGYGDFEDDYDELVGAEEGGWVDNGDGEEDDDEEEAVLQFKKRDPPPDKSSKAGEKRQRTQE